MATVAELQREVEIAREGLKNVDQNIKKLTGRDPSEFRYALVPPDFWTAFSVIKNSVV
jgi:hypothetical protein